MMNLVPKPIHCNLICKGSKLFAAIRRILIAWFALPRIDNYRTNIGTNKSRWSLESEFSDDAQWLLVQISFRPQASVVTLKMSVDAKVLGKESCQILSKCPFSFRPPMGIVVELSGVFQVYRHISNPVIIVEYICLALDLVDFRIYFHYLFIFDPTSILIGPKITRNMLCNPYVNSYAKASELFLRKSRSLLPGSHIY